MLKGDVEGAGIAAQMSMLRGNQPGMIFTLDLQQLLGGFLRVAT